MKIDRIIDCEVRLVHKKARNKRESLGSYKFPGPFVTAYNNGDRITVQEALMITKQDWVQ